MRCPGLGLSHCRPPPPPWAWADLSLSLSLPHTHTPTFSLWCAYARNVRNVRLKGKQAADININIQSCFMFRRCSALPWLWPEPGRITLCVRAALIGACCRCCCRCRSTPGPHPVHSANHVCGYTPFRLRLDNISAINVGGQNEIAVFVDPDNGDSGSRDHGSGWWCKHVIRHATGRPEPACVLAETGRLPLEATVGPCGRLPESHVERRSAQRLTARSPGRGELGAEIR